ncbi:hypothetical protein [Roseateles microcysteis]|uniref:hypothetical protein n=1 Tax=Roseateles microcysteis TaxID=3119057 RepID=UPI002FE6B9DF
MPSNTRSSLEAWQSGLERRFGFAFLCIYQCYSYEDPKGYVDCGHPSIRQTMGRATESSLPRGPISDGLKLGSKG